MFNTDIKLEKDPKKVYELIQKLDKYYSAMRHVENIHEDDKNEVLCYNMMDDYETIMKQLWKTLLMGLIMRLLSMLKVSNHKRVLEKSSTRVFIWFDYGKLSWVSINDGVRVNLGLFLFRVIFNL